MYFVFLFFFFFKQKTAYEMRISDWSSDVCSSDLQRKEYYWQVDNILNWEKTVAGIHNFNISLLANAEKFQSWDNSMDNQGFIPHDGLGYHEIEAGTAPVISSNDETTTGDALMARLIYSLKDRYLLTASVRRDGYSAFGNKNQRSEERRGGKEW